MYMHLMTTFTKPTRSFFEIFQVGNRLEVKAIIPCELYELLQKTYADIIPDPEVEIINGSLFDYAKTNLKFIDANSEKLQLQSMKQLGVDDNTKTMSYQLNYSMNFSKVTWCINTFLFDLNSNHVNFHRLIEAEDNDIVTSIKSSKFKYPTKGGKDVLYTILAITLFVLLAVWLVQANVKMD